MRLFAATLWLIGSVSVATAQTAPPQIPTKELATLKALISKRAAAQAAAPTAQGAAPTPINGSSRATGAPSALGWHVGHPVNCGWLQVGSNQYFFVSTKEADLLFSANNLFASHGLEITCDSGNAFAWHVVDAAGTFDLTASYTFK